MRFVALNRDTERQIVGGALADGWEAPVTVADVLRRIGPDERMHKLDSEQAALDAGVARQGETGSDAREVA